MNPLPFWLFMSLNCIWFKLTFSLFKFGAVQPVVWWWEGLLQINGSCLIGSCQVFTWNFANYSWIVLYFFLAIFRSCTCSSLRFTKTSTKSVSWLRKIRIKIRLLLIGRYSSSQTIDDNESMNTFQRLSGAVKTDISAKYSRPNISHIK